MHCFICEKLKSLRKEHGYTQEQVADALHMSQNAYSLLENRKTRIDVERLFQIAEFYKISVTDLFAPPIHSRKS